MSDFSVEIVRVDDVINHPNADRLNLVKIGGYNCISAKLEDGSPRYKAGDLVAYIPEAAMLPDWLLKKMGFWDEDNNCGTLSGSRKHRVKAIKLRGEVSQGIIYGVKAVETMPGIFRNYIEGDIAPDDEFYADLRDENGQYIKKHIVELGDDVAEFLGIVKYEPSVPTSMTGVMGALYGYTKSYDIESLQKRINAFVEGETVVMTEKCHGTLFEMGIINDEIPEDKLNQLFEVGGVRKAFVTSKGLAKNGFIQKNNEDNQGNAYVRIYNKYFAGTRAEEINAQETFKRLYVFGEVMGRGVQDLDYGMNDPELRVFDVYIVDENGEGRYLNNLELTNFCIKYKIDRVPVVYVGPFSLEVAEKMRDGKTVAGNGQHIREGVVIRPVEERVFDRLPDNRLQLKFVSPDYLLRKDGTEFS